VALVGLPGLPGARATEAEFFRARSGG
jgi:hypothetical protein